MTRFVKVALAAALSLACLPASAQVIAPQQRVPTSDPNIDQICDVLPGTATPVCSRQLNKSAGIVKLLPSALPNPTTTTPGGAYAAQAGAHQFGTGISIFGLPTFAQPVVGDVLGALNKAGDTMTGQLVLPSLNSPASTPLSIQANGKEFLRGFDAGGGLMRIWGQFTADASAAQWLNNGQFVIATENASNSIVGFTVNNLPANTTAFPTGLTGIARVQTPGNTAFALYGEGHLATSNGVAIGAEIDAFAEVNSGPASFSNLNLGIGTPQSITNSLTLGAGTKSVTVTGTTVAGNTTITGLSSLAGLAVGDELESGNIAFGAAITAINVGANSITIGPNAPLTSATVSLRVFPLTSVLAYLAREGGTQGVAQYGFGLAAGAVKQWGYYQDSSGALGANNGGFFGYNGNGAGMVVQYTVATNPLFAAYQLIDPTGTYKWGVRQSGQMDLNGPTSTSVGAAGAASTLPSNPTGYAFIYVGGLQKRVPYYE